MQLAFVHGAGCTSHVFDAQRDAFPDAIVATLPGHTTPGGPDSIDAFADYITGEFERLSLDDVVLCGHSMGGAIALEVALRQNPRVAGVVVVGGGAKMRVAPQIFEEIDRDFPAAARMLAGYFFAEPANEVVEATVAMLLEVGQAQTRRDLRACDAFDATKRLHGLAVPLLALTGDRDPLMPPKFAHALADRVPGGQARIITGAGHFAMLERPADTNEAIRAFVTQIER